MSTRIDHRNHDHDASPYATYRCRKAIRQKATDRAHAIDELIVTFDAKDSSRDWLAYAARRFAGAETSDRRLQAQVVLDYFASSRAWTQTSDPRTILSITLRAAS